MALTADQLFQQSLGLQRGRVNQMYGRNLEILAREMRNRSEALAANLEGRGVFRSGEADTARSRLAEEEAAQRKYLGQDQAYQLSQLDMEERARKAQQGTGTTSSKMMPTTGGRTAQDIQNSFNLEQARQAIAPVGDPYGLYMRKKFNIPGQGFRG